jgi:hypothetical protein
VLHTKEDYQFGKDAKDMGKPAEWKNHQDLVLSNAYFHEATNTLFLHHGIEEDQDGNIETAFRTYVIPETGFKLEKFLIWIKSAERRLLPLHLMTDTKAEGIGKRRANNKERYDKLNSFRPNDEAMQNNANR